MPEYHLVVSPANIPQDDINTYIAKKAFRNFRFHIVAGSSLAMTKVQRAQLVMALFKMGLADAEAVHEMLEFPNAKAMRERMEKDKEKKPQQQSQPKPTTHTKIPPLQPGGGKIGG